MAPLPWWSRTRRPLEWLRPPRDDSSGIPAEFPTYWSVPGQPALHGRGMYLSLRARLRRLRRAFPYDALLVAWAYPEGAAMARFAREAGVPLVTMVLGSDVNEFTRHPALRQQILSGLRACQRVVAVSGALRDRVVALGVEPERVLVQRNGVDGERFRPGDRSRARERLGLPQDRRLACYVGNFKPEKGVDVLVEAMGKLAREDVDLALVGSGPLEPSLRERVSALGLEDRVRFQGRRPHSEIPEWMTAADVVCLPSHREGCPNVVLEALASGRPVVATEVGGVPELLDSRSGAVVPPADPAAFASGLAEVLGRSWNPQALRSTVECLSWDQYGQTLHSALRQAIEEHRRAGTPQAASR